MNKIEWIFPKKNLFLMRLEILFIALSALFIFILSYFQFELIRYAVLLTGLFICIYVLMSAGVQAYHRVEERYKIDPKLLHIVRKTRSKTREEKVPLKDFKHHKLDHFFLGGYVVSKKGKHLLFFNTKEEIQKFEGFLKKYWKK